MRWGRSRTAGIAGVAVAAGVVVVWAAGVAGFRSGFEPRADDPLGTVRAFEAALADGDGAGVVDLIAEDYVGIYLPGLSEYGLTPDGGRDELQERLGFFATVAGVDLGRCWFRPPLAARAATDVVVCPDATFVGPYLRAVSDRSQTRGLSIAIRDGYVIGINHSWGNALTGYRRYEAYCRWMRAHRPDMAERAFGTSCLPVETPEAGLLLDGLADEFLAARAGG